jgi:amino acid adenylation domain-containing protein
VRKKRGKLDKKNIEDISALTPMQEGMLFHYLKDPKSEQYFEQLSLKIVGLINVELFEKAWNFVIETNEMLRTVFRWKEVEQPIQIILREHNLSWKYDDLSDKNPQEREEILDEIKTKNKSQGFDLQDVPFRVNLIKVKEDEYDLVISNHHILYDGWSNGIILKEFFDAYADLFARQTPLKQVKTSFKEFIQWIHSQDKTKQKWFWQGYLAGIESQAELPIKIKRKQTGESEFAKNHSVILKGAIKNQLEIFVKTNEVTLAAFFYSAWGILLQKYGNSSDVIFGTTVSGRSARIKGIEDMVGLFINTIPLHVRTTSGEKITDLVQGINYILPIREEYESTPLVDIKEYSELEDTRELFNSIIALENYPLHPQLMQDPAQSPLVVNSYSMVEATNYDLTISITISDTITINFIYHPLLFEKSSILRLSCHFNNIIEYILDNSRSAISEIEILSKTEKRRILYEFNDTGAYYPKNRHIHRLFGEQVEKTPDNIALHGCMIAWMPGEEVSITYRELNQRTDQLAFLLKEKNVQTDTIVGIMLDRSLEMIIGILAILKAGGAYLPIDPGYPEERISYMLADSNVGVLVTSPKLQVKVKGKFIEIIDISDLSSLSTSTPPLTCQVSSNNLAYIIYTSGSTGQPKGVMVAQFSAVNLLWALHNKYPFRESDVYLLKTSYFFDVSVCELFGWFFGGGRLAVLEQNGEKDPKKILDTIENARVTHINFVPSMFKVFTDALNPQNIKKLSTLRYIFLAGETLLPQLISRFRRLNAAIVLENIYGPTEATVYASWYSLSLWSGEDMIPIGKPLPNVKLFILDRSLNLQPVGVPGELSTAGVGVARGYLNNPALTAEKFGQDLWDYQDYHDENNEKFLRGVQGGSFFKKGGGTPNPFTVSQMPFFRSFISKVCRKNKVSDLGASSQKFAEKTKFQKVLVKSVPLAAGGKSFTKPVIWPGGCRMGISSF